MTSSKDSVVAATLAINHLNEVLNDVRNDRDRCQVALENERMRREAHVLHAGTWVSECRALIQGLRSETEALLCSLVEVSPSGTMPERLEEEFRLLAQHRAQLKAIERWLDEEREGLTVLKGEAPAETRRLSRLNHLNNSSFTAMEIRKPASEWGELTSVSGFCALASDRAEHRYKPGA